jgi:hypothetical protein
MRIALWLDAIRVAPARPGFQQLQHHRVISLGDARLHDDVTVDDNARCPIRPDPS